MRGNYTNIAEETEITQSFRAVEEEQAAPPPPPERPPGPPPRAVLADVWPWLALLGVLAVAGLLVWLFLLRGGHAAARTVPGVVGLRERAAITRLMDAGYGVKSIHEPLERPRGSVGAQAPGGGSRLPKGATVVLHVSNGRKPPAAVTTTAAATTTTTAHTTTAPAPTVQVPDVTGQELAAGAGQVEAAGFVAETDPLEGAGGAPGSVVQESPPGGGRAQAGETVTLGIAVGSSRPATQIPNVVGRTAAAARAALLDAKLTVRTAYRQGKPGVVLGESPTGSAPAYTQVTIVVGR